MQMLLVEMVVIMEVVEQDHGLVAMEECMVDLQDLMEVSLVMVEQ